MKQRERTWPIKWEWEGELRRIRLEDAPKFYKSGGRGYGLRYEPQDWSEVAYQIV